MQVIEQELSPEDQKEIQEKTQKKLAKRQARYYLQCEVLDDNLLISGQKREVWEQKFKMYIPAEALTPELCCDFDRKIMDLHQEATFLYNAAVARAQYLAHDSKDEYYHHVQTMVEEYKTAGKRLPSAAAVDNLCNLANMDQEYNAIAGEMECKYWKGILDHLSTCRKIIENVSLNISVERKSEYAANFMNRKRED